MGESARTLREQAARCRRLIPATDDLRTKTALADLAQEYTAKADQEDREERKANARLP